MAERDIMPWRAPHGGTTVVQPYSLLTTQTFLTGEVLSLDTATGQLEEAADDPDINIHLDGGAVGVAAEPAQGMAADAAGTTNPAGARRSVWQFTTDQEFITANYNVDGAATTAYATGSCTLAQVGETVGLMLNTTAGSLGWGITLVATNEQFRITGILDANKQPIMTLAAATTVFVTFKREPVA